MAQRGKGTILIVDDSDALIEEITPPLVAAGFEVGIASDGEEVFRKITAYNPDLVLLDVYMPKIDGPDVVRLLRGHPRWAGMRLLLMSGRASDEDIERFLRMGADDFLRKPFKAQVLVERVRAKANVECC